MHKPKITYGQLEQMKELAQQSIDAKSSPNNAKPNVRGSKKPCCDKCDGTGLSPDGKGFSDTPYVCSKCNGSGR